MFSDILLSPLIVFGSITILVAFVSYLLTHGVEVEIQVAISTLLGEADLRDSLLFVAHVFILNFFVVLLTEPHWFRVWIFGQERSHQLQGGSMAATSALWTLLAVIGLLGGVAAPSMAVGFEHVANLLEQSVLREPLFIVLFWVAAAAAVLSTAEAQIYSLLLMNAYNAKTGQISWVAQRPGHPFLLSCAAAFMLAIIYYGVEKLELPFEKLVFILVPICLNGLPALICVVRRVPLKTWYLYLSITLYVSCTLVGLSQQKQVYLWTLMAAVVPLAVSVLVLLKSLIRRA